MPGRVDHSAEDLHLALPAGRASSTGGIDMDPGLHGRLEEIGLGIDKDLSTAGLKGDRMLCHDSL